MFLPPGSGFRSVTNWRSINAGGKAAFAFILLTIIIILPTVLFGVLFALGGSRRTAQLSCASCFLSCLCCMVCLCAYGGQIYAKQAEEKRYGPAFHCAVSAFVLLATAFVLLVVAAWRRVPVLLHAGRQNTFVLPPRANPDVVPPPPDHADTTLSFLDSTRGQISFAREPVIVVKEPAVIPPVPAHPSPRRARFYSDSESSSSSSSSSYSSSSLSSSSASSYSGSSESTEIIHVVTLQAPSNPTNNNNNNNIISKNGIVQPVLTTYAATPRSIEAPALLYYPGPVSTPRVLVAGQGASIDYSPTYIDANVRAPGVSPNQHQHQHQNQQRAEAGGNISPRIVSATPVFEYSDYGRGGADAHVRRDHRN